MDKSLQGMCEVESVDDFLGPSSLELVVDIQIVDDLPYLKKRRKNVKPLT